MLFSDNYRYYLRCVVVAVSCGCFSLFWACECCFGLILANFLADWDVPSTNSFVCAKPSEPKVLSLIALVKVNSHIFHLNAIRMYRLTKHRIAVSSARNLKKSFWLLPGQLWCYKNKPFRNNDNLVKLTMK